MTTLMLGVQLMLYGLGGVFLSLIIFYIIIKIFVGMISRSAKKSAEK